MTDTAFRTRLGESTPEALPNASTGPHTASQVQIEVPFTDYKLEHPQPFTAEHYQLGDTWEDPDGGFGKEVSTIESYLRNEIETGEMANSISAVRNKLKQIEKLTNVFGEERTVIRISTVAAYMKFLQETQDIKNHIKKYGRS